MQGDMRMIEVGFFQEPVTASISQDKLNYKHETEFPQRQTTHSRGGIRQKFYASNNAIRLIGLRHTRCPAMGCRPRTIMKASPGTQAWVRHIVPSISMPVSLQMLQLYNDFGTTQLLLPTDGQRA